MTESQTATVETLVAEVRVLMVGSRQITLSVAKQLDVVALGAIRPFGRVCVDDTGTVIGACLKTGALVKARYSTRPSRGAPVYLPALSPPIAVCSALKDQDIRLSFRGRSVVPYDATFCGIKGHDRWSNQRCAVWVPDQHADAIADAIAKFDAHIALEVAAAALPLIVLAGLK